MWRLFLLIAVWIPLGTSVEQARGSATADAAALPEIKSIEVGFGNHYKLGCWTPVDITLRGAAGDSGAADRIPAGRIDVQAADSDGVPAWFVGPSIAGNKSGEHTVYVRIGRANQPIRVRLSTGADQGEAVLRLLAGPTVEASPVALPATNEFVAELGASIGLPEMFRQLNEREAERTAVVTIDGPRQLPDRWYGYDGVDMVVIAGAPAVEKSLLSAAALDALEKWVQEGGELLICCGQDAQRVMGMGGPLARFAPGQLAGLVNLPAARFGSIENFAVAEQRLEATSIRVPQWKDLPSDRRIELSGGVRAEDLPLVVRWPLGFGQVIYVGLDLDRPPFTDWPSRGKFLEKLLAKQTHLIAQAVGPRAASQGKQLGYVDLSGQLRGALDQFAGVQLVPFWAVALLALAYIGLLFPLSYWVVTHWLRRQSLAWVLFPAVVTLFCMAAYALASYAKGNVRRVNQVDLVDVDVAAGHVRGATWLNIFSPENALYNLQAEPRFSSLEHGGASGNATAERETSPTLLSWFGLPGVGLGGMNSATVNRSLFDEPYTIDPSRGTISGVPLAAWSSQSFVARWEKVGVGIGGGVEASLAATADRRLRGTIVNRLDAPLSDCVLLFDRWAYPLETLEPGKLVALDRLESQTIDTYLTKRRTIAAHDEVPPYDRSSFDIQRIIEVMMFYEATGGSNYAGLLNRYQRFTDLTNQLEFGRAILVGRGPDGAVVQIDQQPPAGAAAAYHTSVYRFVLQVKPPDGS
jgi:hypothetical protein